MKKSISKFVLFTAIIFSLQACSTPEERATVVDGADTTSSTSSSSSDSLNSASGSMDTNNDSSKTSGSGDSTKSNKKMESFRHTPIDTITSLEDSSKQ